MQPARHHQQGTGGEGGEEERSADEHHNFIYFSPASEKHSETSFRPYKISLCTRKRYFSRLYLKIIFKISLLLVRISYTQTLKWK